MKRRQTVLVIDDSAEIFPLVKARLASLDVELHYCNDGEQGLVEANRLSPDLILLDVSMPGLGGFEVCRRLKQNPATQEIPVIFLTASDDPDAKVRGFDVGAIDYVTKPFNPGEIKARVRSALRTQMLIDLLESQARTDSLTGLANRKGFIESLERCLQRCRENHRRFAVLFLDLDRFKAVNDECGHEVGDALLVRVAHVLSDGLRTDRRGADPEQCDVIGRMGGDEFVVLLEDIDEVSDATRVAQRMQKAISGPMVIEGHSVSIGASIGVRMGGSSYERCDDLLREADSAMYQAKATQRGSLVVFEAPSVSAAVIRPSTECDLTDRIETGDLRLLYQPIVNLESGGVIGFEAMLHAARRSGEQGRIIPLIEPGPCLAPLTEWMIEQGCGDLARWRSESAEAATLSLHMNMSNHQMLECDVPKLMHRELGRAKVDAASIVIEMGEGQFLGESQALLPVTEQLRAMGVSLALDHFGREATSLMSLHRLPLDMVKIDPSFIRCLSYSRRFAAMVGAIVTLAWNLKLEVVAAGIETLDQAAQLQALDCGCGQGSLFAAPMPAESVVTYLQQTAVVKQGA